MRPSSLPTIRHHEAPCLACGSSSRSHKCARSIHCAEAHPRGSTGLFRSCCEQPTRVVEGTDRPQWLDTLQYGYYLSVLQDSLGIWGRQHWQTGCIRGLQQSHHWSVTRGIHPSREHCTDMITAWSRTGNTVTTRPAYIYVEPGTYRIKSPIQMLVSTYLIGDPLSPPTFIADPALQKQPVIIGYDGLQGEWSATKNFYMALRNVIIDTSQVLSSVDAVALDWSVSQGCSLVNVHVKMPLNSNHVGMTMGNGGSGTIISDSVREDDILATGGECQSADKLCRHSLAAQSVFDFPINSITSKAFHSTVATSASLSNMSTSPPSRTSVSRIATSGLTWAESGQPDLSR